VCVCVCDVWKYIEFIIIGPTAVFGNLLVSNDRGLSRID